METQHIHGVSQSPHSQLLTITSPQGDGNTSFTTSAQASRKLKSYLPSLPRKGMETVLLNDAEYYLQLVTYHHFPARGWVRL